MLRLRVLIIATLGMAIIVLAGGADHENPRPSAIPPCETPPPGGKGKEPGHFDSPPGGHDHVEHDYDFPPDNHESTKTAEWDLPHGSSNGDKNKDGWFDHVGKEKWRNRGSYKYPIVKRGKD
jgi:hypothetical protein